MYPSDIEVRCVGVPLSITPGRVHGPKSMRELRDSTSLRMVA